MLPFVRLWHAGRKEAEEGRLMGDEAFGVGRASSRQPNNEGSDSKSSFSGVL